MKQITQVKAHHKKKPTDEVLLTKSISQKCKQ